MPKQNMFDIVKYCNQKNSECVKAEYLKVATGGNNPNISQKMRYSQYVQSFKPKTVYTRNLNPVVSTDFAIDQVTINQVTT